MRVSTSTVLVLCCAVALFQCVANAAYSESSGVVELTDSTFSSKVLKADGLWIIHAYSSKPADTQLESTFIKAAETLKGIAQVGAISVAKYDSYLKSIKVSPKSNDAAVFYFGWDKSNPVEFSGERNVKGFAGAALKEIRDIVSSRINGGKPKSSSSSSSSSSGSSSSSSSSSGSSSGPGSKGEVVEITDKDFDKLVLGSTDAWMVSFTAPWCGHCKNLKPEWKNAASQLGGKVKFANIDCTRYESLCGRYNVRGYPTIKHFRAGAKGPSFQGEDYREGRTASALAAYASRELEKYTPPPETVELVNQSTFEECQKGQLCVIGFLPHILDSGAKGRKDYIASMNTAMKSFTRHPIKWTWSGAQSHPNLQTALDVGGAGFPTLVAYSSKRGRAATMRNAFTADGIKEFIDTLMSGSAGTIPVKLPTITTITPWNGKDAAPTKVEL